MRIESFDRAASADDIMPTLARDGVAVIREIAPSAAMDRLEADLEPHLAGREPGGGEFFGFRTKRLGGIVGRSRAFADLIADPLLLALADAVLLSNCKTYHIQLSGILEVWPGGKHQPLHRDTGPYYPYIRSRPGDPEILLSLMWAVSDFTAENGATRVIPGSHLWEREREATEEDIVQAVMPKGSVLVWLGSLLHGMGVNGTDAPRTGLVSAYSVGCLRQEENQYLSCPPEVAAELPGKVQQLLGYKAHSPILGWVEDRDWELLLRPGTRGVENYEEQPLQSRISGHAGT